MNPIEVQVSGGQGIVPSTYKTIVLKPNIVNGKNILTQAMFAQTNAKYVIKYDYIIDNDIVTESVQVLSSNVSQCVNPAYLEALTAYNEAHDAWIDADNAYTNNPNETTLAAKNAAYASYTVAQTTLNNTPQYYYYAAKAISLHKGQHIIISDDCILLNNSRNAIAGFEIAPVDSIVYIGSLIPETYEYTVQEAIQIPARCLIEFDGGSISNGTLVCNNTVLIFEQEEEVVLKNITLLGEFTYPSANVADKKDNTNGMAKVYLKKNKSFISQVTQSNTIYVIQYDFDLGGESITIPTDCILEFDGGSLNNGTLFGDDTSIRANKVAIFNSITITGTWNVPEIYSAWFEDAQDVNKLKEVFNLCNNNNNLIIIDSGLYSVAVSGTQQNEAILNLKSNTYVLNSGTIKIEPTEIETYRIFQIFNVVNVTINGGIIQGDKYTHIGTTGEWGHGIYINGTKGVNIQNVEVKECWGDGICIATRNTERVNIIDCYIHDCRRQGISVTGGNFINIDNTKITDISGTAPYACIDLEPNDNQYVKNVVINSCYLDSDKGILMTGADTERQIENITVSNCSITANNNPAIQVNHGNGVFITNNEIIYNGSNTSIVVSTSYNIIFEANRFQANNETLNSHRLFSLTNSGYDTISVINNTINTNGILLFFRGSVKFINNNISASTLFSNQSLVNLNESVFEHNTINNAVTTLTSYIKWKENIFNETVAAGENVDFNDCIFKGAVSTVGAKVTFTKCTFYSTFDNNYGNTVLSSCLFKQEINFSIASGRGVGLNVSNCVFNNNVTIGTAGSEYANNTFNGYLTITRNGNTFYNNTFNNKTTSTYYSYFYGNTFDVNKNKNMSDTDFTLAVEFKENNILINNRIINVCIIINGTLFEGNILTTSFPASSGSTKKIIDCLDGCMVINNKFTYTGEDDSIEAIMLSRTKNVISQNVFNSNSIIVPLCVAIKTGQAGGAIFKNNIIKGNITEITNNSGKFLNIVDNIVL